MAAEAHRQRRAPPACSTSCVAVSNAGTDGRGVMTTATAARPICSATIVAATRRIVEVREARDARGGAGARRRRGRRAGAAFERALAAARATEPPRVIAECKRRSPSRGILRADYDPAAHARAYADAGAAAISVLTEPTFFDGALEHLARGARGGRPAAAAQGLHRLASTSSLEAAALGRRRGAADRRRAGRPRRCGGCSTTPRALGLAALVEVHDVDGAGARASMRARAIVGVNSRNLRTLARGPRRARRGRRQRCRAA